MPPKIRITKESIVATAVDLVRRDGAGAINARTIATTGGISAQNVAYIAGTYSMIKISLLLQIR